MLLNFNYLSQIQLTLFYLTLFVLLFLCFLLSFCVTFLVICLYVSSRGVPMSYNQNIRSNKFQFLMLLTCITSVFIIVIVVSIIFWESLMSFQLLFILLRQLPPKVNVTFLDLHIRIIQSLPSAWCLYFGQIKVNSTHRFKIVMRRNRMKQWLWLIWCCWLGRILEQVLVGQLVVSSILFSLFLFLLNFIFLLIICI